MAKTDKIKEHAKQKSSNRQAEVLAAIKDMVKAGEKVTFYSVQKKTGASKSYLYNNEAISNAIKGVRDGATPRSDNSNAAIVAALRTENKKLKKELAELKKANDDSYKAKYEKAKAEVEKLKKQLEKAYTVW